MSNKNGSLRMACATTLGIVLLSSSMLTIMGDDTRLRLDRRVLDDSRGGTLSLVLGQTNCTAFNYVACAAVGNNCSACSKTQFTQAVPGIDGGYNAGVLGQYPIGGCGSGYNGTCAANLTCTTAGNPTATCWSESLPSIQPQ